MGQKARQEFSDREHGPSQAPRRLCIVVADDDRDAVLTLMMLLREEGHDTVGAYTAQETLDAVLKQDPDVLILDIALGKASGYDVARKIRDRHGEKRPMIIGVSGQYKKSSDRILSEIAGFNHYLVKPYDVGVLLSLIAPLRDFAPKLDSKDEDHPSATYRAAVESAVVAMGGARELADRLQVRMTDLTRWLAGTHTPPLDVFLRVVDIVLEARKKSLQELASAALLDFPKSPKTRG